jgi:uncharacterized protein (TIGR02598 family)
MALGITTVALMAVLGLFPLALSVYRDSRTDAVKVQVMDVVQSRLQKTRFQDVPTLMGFPYYFDYDGVQVNDSGAIFRVDASLVSGNNSVKILRLSLKNQKSGTEIGRFPVVVSESGRL